MSNPLLKWSEFIAALIAAIVLGLTIASILWNASSETTMVQTRLSRLEQQVEFHADRDKQVCEANREKFAEMFRECDCLTYIQLACP